jgi:hypothetical protein
MSRHRAQQKKLQQTVLKENSPKKLHIHTTTTRMSRLMQPLGLRITSNQARAVLTNQWVKSHAHLQQQQIRCKVSSRQTGGGKSKAGGKPNENRSAQTKGYLKKPKSASGNSADGKTDRFETFRQVRTSEPFPQGKAKF